MAKPTSSQQQSFLLREINLNLVGKMPDENYGGGWEGGPGSGGELVPGGARNWGGAYAGVWGGPTGGGGYAGGWGPAPPPYPPMCVGGYAGGWGPAPPPSYPPAWAGGYSSGGYGGRGIGGGGYDDEGYGSGGYRRGGYGGGGRGGRRQGGERYPDFKGIEIGSNNKSEQGNNDVKLRFDLSKLKDIPERAGGVHIASGQYARDNGNKIDFSEYNDPAPPPQPPESRSGDRIGIRIGVARRW